MAAAGDGDRLWLWTTAADQDLGAATAAVGDAWHGLATPPDPEDPYGQSPPGTGTAVATAGPTMVVIRPGGHAQDTWWTGSEDGNWGRAVTDIPPPVRQWREAIEGLAADAGTIVAVGRADYRSPARSEGRTWYSSGTMHGWEEVIVDGNLTDVLGVATDGHRFVAIAVKGDVPVVLRSERRAIVDGHRRRRHRPVDDHDHGARRRRVRPRPSSGATDRSPIVRLADTYLVQTRRRGLWSSARRDHLVDPGSTSPATARRRRGPLCAASGCAQPSMCRSARADGATWTRDRRSTLSPGTRARSRWVARRWAWERAPGTDRVAGGPGEASVRPVDTAGLGTIAALTARRGPAWLAVGSTPTDDPEGDPGSGGQPPARVTGSRSPTPCDWSAGGPGRSRPRWCSTAARSSAAPPATPPPSSSARPEGSTASDVRVPSDLPGRWMPTRRGTRGRSGDDRPARSEARRRVSESVQDGVSQAVVSIDAWLITRCWNGSRRRCGSGSLPVPGADGGPGRRGGRPSRSGEHTLILAPTGSGKTLVRLPVGHRLAGHEPGPRRTRRSAPALLYLSPLRALAVDVEKNLRAPLLGIEPRSRAARARLHRADGRHAHRRHARPTSGASSSATRPTSSSRRPSPSTSCSRRRRASCSRRSTPSSSTRSTRWPPPSAARTWRSALERLEAIDRRSRRSASASRRRSARSTTSPASSAASTDASRADDRTPVPVTIVDAGVPKRSRVEVDRAARRPGRRSPRWSTTERRPGGRDPRRASGRQIHARLVETHSGRTVHDDLRQQPSARRAARDPR